MTKEGTQSTSRQEVQQKCKKSGALSATKKSGKESKVFRKVYVWANLCGRRRDIPLLKGYGITLKWIAPYIVNMVEETILATPYDSVSLQRGLGYSGKRMEIVEKTCDSCRFDRMVRLTRVSPEYQDQISDKCLVPGCLDYHDGEWDFLFPVSSIGKIKAEKL